MVSVDDLESLEQTLDILSRPALIKQIRGRLDDLVSEGATVLPKDDAMRRVEIVAIDHRSQAYRPR